MELQDVDNYLIVWNPVVRKSLEYFFNFGFSAIFLKSFNFSN